MNPENTGDREREPVVRWPTLLSVAAAVVFLTLVPATGQWLKYPTPGIPRLPDGKPDLAAPTRRTVDGNVDLSGLWQPNAGGYQHNATADLSPSEFRPWAAALTKQRVEHFGRDNPVARCLPPGPAVRAMMAMVKIVQTPSLIVMLYESGILDRQIFMDGRALPQDPNPTWMGYSVGHWDGDTLVVESAGFNDKTWLDLTGHPHSEELRLTERFTRRDFGHMQLHMTIDDPRAYARPFTVPVDLRFVGDTELLEEVCNENERDAARTAGATMSAITLPSSVLSIPRNIRGHGWSSVRDRERLRRHACRGSGDAAASRRQDWSAARTNLGHLFCPDRRRREYRVCQRRCGCCDPANLSKRRR